MFWLFWKFIFRKLKKMHKEIQFKYNLLEWYSFK
jgi:hypothetical protein